MLRIIENDDNGIPIASADLLNRYAAGILSEYSPDILTEPGSTDLEGLAELYCHANLDVRSITPNGEILGATIFNGGCIELFSTCGGWKIEEVSKGTILIESEIVNRKGRFRFTLAHEIAHLLLHYKANISTGTMHRYAKSDGSIIMCRPDETVRTGNEKRTPADWMEWQADKMAAALLMPESTFRYVFGVFLKNSGYDARMLRYALNQSKKENKPFAKCDIYEELIQRLTEIFEVSKAAAKYRLQDLHCF